MGKLQMKCMTLLMILVLVLQGNAYAEIVGFEGGAVGDPTMDDNTFEYEEMFFLTGKPIKLTGTVSVPDQPGDDETEYSLDYDFELQNVEEGVTLSRSVSFDVVEIVNESMQQTTYKADIDSLDETITAGANTYTLGGYLFDESQLIDNTPAVDYFNGNLYAKRKYFINGDQINNDGVVTVEITSDSYVGYEHLWVNQKPRSSYMIFQALCLRQMRLRRGRWTGQVTLK